MKESEYIFFKNFCDERAFAIYEKANGSPRAVGFNGIWDNIRITNIEYITALGNKIQIVGKVGDRRIILDGNEL